MQTNAFIKQLQDIAKKCKIDELCEVLSPLLDYSQPVAVSDTIRGAFTDTIFEARDGLASCIANPEALQVTELLGIMELLQPRQIAKMVAKLHSVESTAEIFSSPADYALFQSLFANLHTLRLYISALEQQIWKHKQSALTDSDRILEVEVCEYDASGLQPARLAAVLESLHRLHALIAKVVEDKISKLHIAYLDSGPDFILGLQVGFKVAEILKTLFQQFWQKIRFKAPDEIDRHSDGMMKNLNIIQHIARHEKNGVLDAETAAKLKTAIIEEMINLVSIGVLLKEYEQEEKYERKKLLIEKRDLKAVIFK
ncbi:MAG: hypothetical protein LWX56_13020 [Ignavibacteria bacterium]|nr:hypothetical protein [Ignavibacteria bacterium]